MSQANESFDGVKVRWKAIFYFALSIQLILVAILTYTLPSNVLALMPLLDRGIEWLSTYVTGLVRYDRLSEFPGVAQLVWALQLAFVPFWAVLTVKASKPNFTMMRRIRLILVFCLPALAAGSIFLIFYMPITPISKGIAIYPEFSEYLLGSRLEFVLSSIVITVASGAGFGMIFMTISALPILFGTYREN